MARAARTAAEALRSILEKAAGAPSAGVFARAAPKNSDAAELLQQWTGIEQELSVLDKLQTQNGARIEKWQELPKGSAASISEARELVDAVEEEIGKIKDLAYRLEKAAKIAKRVQFAEQHVVAIKSELDGSLKDTEADKQNLLVAARDVLVRDAPKDGSGRALGVSEIPLHVQVERALADAHESHEARTDESLGLKLLPSPDEKSALRKKLLGSIDDEMKLQKTLEERVGAALSAAREAGAPPPSELKNAAEQLRAWGHGLAYERQRLAAG